MTNGTQNLPNTERRNRRIGGIALLTIGLLALVAQVVDLGMLGLLILPALSLIFLAWGISTREAGLLIPGGILAGIGVGVLLMTGTALGELSETAGPGVFLVAFGAGWALITLVSALFTDETVWWALIPGGILAAIGGALVVGGPALTLLELVGRLWPLALVAAGLYLLFRRFNTD